MEFWSRFQNPPPLLAFAGAEWEDDFDDASDLLSDLPRVPDNDSTVYSLKISLDGARPAVWRKVLVANINLETLHYVIQIAMGWTDAHLHSFEINDVRVPAVEEGAAVTERSISISQLESAEIDLLRYVYDFGDEWNHSIQIEDAFRVVDDTAYPLCIGGKGLCPLEDIGGTKNWSRLLRALKNPELHSQTSEIGALLDRVGKDYVPSAFDIDETNGKLQRAFHRKFRRKGHA